MFEKSFLKNLTKLGGIAVHRLLLLQRLLADLMELALWYHLRALLLQDSQIRRRQHVKILPLVLLLIADFLHALLDHLLRSQQHREVILDVHEDDESVADLNVILRAQARDDRLGDFEVPLVTDVTEVLKSNVVVRVRALE